MEKWIARKGKTYAGHDDDHVMDVAEAADPSRVVFRGFWGNHERALIAAAAPELLEALDDAPVISKYHGMGGFDLERYISDHHAWAARARAAIAKARGEV